MPGRGQNLSGSLEKPLAGSHRQDIRKCRYGRAGARCAACHGAGSRYDEEGFLVAGRPWVGEQRLAPTMTVYSPKGKNTGVAVVVFPGGGYQILAIDLEGTEVADWLTSKGITCVLLKYRVPYLGAIWDRES